MRDENTRMPKEAPQLRDIHQILNTLSQLNLMMCQIENKIDALSAKVEHLYDTARYGGICE